jgi:hypothetical protein
MAHIVKFAFSWIVDALPDFVNLILVLVGVIMSLPKLAEKIEDNTKARRTVAIVCLVLGLAGFWASVYQRRQANSETEALLNSVKTLVTNTNTLVTNTNTTVLLVPQVSALNTRIAELDGKIEAAKGDPQLVSKLEEEAASEREKAKSTTTKLLLAMVPGIQMQLSNIENRIYSDEEPLRAAVQSNGDHAGQFNARTGGIRARYANEIKSAMISVEVVGGQLYRMLPSSYAGENAKDYKQMQTVVAQWANGVPISTEADLDVCRNYLGQLAQSVSNLLGR